MNKKVAVILSGCGVYDGSEIYESVITLLRLDQRGVKVQCFAPNIAQMHVINHLTGEEMPESRNVLTESARLARGEIKDLREARAEDFDALIMPGGFGAAKNLSTFATEGANSKALPDVVALVKAFAEARIVLAGDAAQMALPELAHLLPEPGLRLHQLGRVGHHRLRQLGEGVVDDLGVGDLEAVARRLVLKEGLHDALALLGELGHHPRRLGGWLAGRRRRHRFLRNVRATFIVGSTTGKRNLDRGATIARR